MTQDASEDKVTIQAAARKLGVKEDAVRKRIQRGSVDHEKGKDGRIYVYLEAAQDMTQDATEDTSQDASEGGLVEVLRDQVEYLRNVIEVRDRELKARTEEIHRRDVIISQLAQRIPELPPAEREEESSEAHESADSSPEGEEARTEQADLQASSQHPQEQKRSWWKRIFGG